MGQCAIRLSAYRCPLPAGHGHSERSEESRCVSLVISMPINTSGREDSRLSDDRHQISDNRRQTYCIPEHKRVQAPSAPGSRPRRGLAPGGLRFRPQSGRVQREVINAACGGKIFTTAPAARGNAPLLLSAAPYESSDMFPFRRKVVRQYQKGRISIGRSPVMKAFVTKGSAAAAGGTI